MPLDDVSAYLLVGAGNDCNNKKNNNKNNNNNNNATMFDNYSHGFSFLIFKDRDNRGETKRGPANSKVRTVLP